MSDYGSIPPPPPPPQEPFEAFGAYGAQGTPPPSYLVWAILSAILCVPLGVASVIFSTQVNTKWAVGDVAGAQSASRRARNFAIWSAIAWALSLLVVVIFGLLVHSLSSLTVK